MTVVNKDKVPVALEAKGIVARAIDLGEYNLGVERWPKGNYDRFFKGLPNDMCQAAHHGIVLKGRGRYRYADGTVEDVGPGDIYYARPGHLWEVLEDGTEIVEFSVKDKVLEDTYNVVGKNLEAWLAKEP
jgi:hypothetical protein